MQAEASGPYLALHDSHTRVGGAQIDSDDLVRPQDARYAAVRRWDDEWSIVRRWTIEPWERHHSLT